jgi:hypothetical protein
MMPVVAQEGVRLQSTGLCSCLICRLDAMATGPPGHWVAVATSPTQPSARTRLTNMGRMRHLRRPDLARPQVA